MLSLLVIDGGHCTQEPLSTFCLQFLSQSLVRVNLTATFPFVVAHLVCQSMYLPRLSHLHPGTAVSGLYLMPVFCVGFTK